MGFWIVMKMEMIEKWKVEDVEIELRVNEVL